ncbi:MAG: polysaccharide deacetylase family protein [Acidimicrobiales bacterium]
MSPEVFARQMAFLSRRRQVVGLEELVEGPRSGARPMVAITFDDGYRNVLVNAGPVLRTYGFPATLFVPTKWIGKDNAWEAGGPCHPLPVMDEDELRAAGRRGITVESHGHGHLDLERSDPWVAASDLRASYDCLAGILGRAPRFLAYPYGRQSPVVRAAAEATGFAHAFGFNTPEAGRYGHERVSIDGREGPARFALKTRGGYLARRHSPVGGALSWVAVSARGLTARLPEGARRASVKGTT